MMEKDYKGVRFNNLIAIEFQYKRKDDKIWSFICDCGRIVNKILRSVKSGHTTTCGCRRDKTIDLSNRRFGRLVALEIGYRDKHKRTFWKCVCDCGNKVEVPIQDLNKKATQSCGCLQKELNTKRFFKGYGDISLTIFNRIKKSAITRNLEFDVTIEYLDKMLKDQNYICPLSGYTIISTIPYRTNPIQNTASLDRIDSSKGYIVGNVQWVHKYLNIMKWELSNEEFIQICSDVVKNNKFIK